MGYKLGLKSLHDVSRDPWEWHRMMTKHLEWLYELPKIEEMTQTEKDSWRDTIFRVRIKLKKAESLMLIECQGEITNLNIMNRY